MCESLTWSSAGLTTALVKCFNGELESMKSSTTLSTKAVRMASFSRASFSAAAWASRAARAGSASGPPLAPPPPHSWVRSKTSDSIWWQRSETRSRCPGGSTEAI